MQGYLIDKNGTETSLPELLSWDVCHALYDSCDYFELTAVYSDGLLSKLADAVKFRGIFNGVTVFYGVIDEYTVNISENGAVLSVNGRSLAALLMDNEVPKVTYYTMTKSSLTEKYLSPYGIRDIASCTMPQVLMFPVKAGDSAWSAVKRFCLKSAHTEPRFSPAGQLLLKGASGSTLTLNADTQASEVFYRDSRYGIISHITVTNRASGGSYTVSNQAFIQRGGSCRRYLYTDRFETVVSNPQQVTEKFTGQHQIDCSKRGKNIIKVTVPEQFFCFPGDTVNFSSTALGFSGSYTVTETECRADALGGETVICLEV